MTDRTYSTVCTACGTVDSIDLTQALADEKARTLAVTEALAREQQTVKGLKSQLAERREAKPMMPAAKRLFEHWRTVCDHRKTKGFDKRADLVLRWLMADEDRDEDRFTEAELRRSIDGYAAFPDVSKTGRCRRGEGKRFDKFEFVFRDEVNIGKGLDLADRADNENAAQVIAAIEADFEAHREEMAREPVDRLLRTLTELGLAWGPAPDPDRWLSTCPNDHPDEDATLFIDRTEAGTVALRCFAGCKGWEVVLGLELELSLCSNHGAEWGRPAMAEIAELRPAPQLEIAA